MDKQREYPFEFSIIMSVYNMEKYLREAVDSIVNQNFGMERVQLIFVDDGSSDLSGMICDEYATLYPDNITVIHKENGGLSSARNEGLKYATGRYINFCDPDDYFSCNVLSKVHSFFVDREDDVDVVCIPLKFFGSQKGDHPLNYKFKKGTRVINLNEEFSMIHLQAASAFVRNEAAQVMDFDTEIVTAEDAKEFVKILTNKLALGVVTGCQYNYRKHAASIVSGATKKRNFYVTYMKRYCAWAIDYCNEKLGYVPKFVQFMLMYDLQWKIRQEKIPEGILSQEERKEYDQFFSDVLKNIDNDIILAQKYLYSEYKLYTLYRKYEAAPMLIKTTSDTLYCFGTTGLYYSNFNPIKIEFMKIQKDKFTVEGSLVVPIFNNRPEIYVDINGKQFECTKFSRCHVSLSLDDKVAEQWGFKYSFNLDEEVESYSIRFFIKQGDGMIQLKKFRFGEFSPINNKYYYSYYIKNGRKLYFSKNRIIVKKCGKREHIRSEWNFCKELWKKNLLGGRKAVVARFIYHIAKFLKKNSIWLISDRVVKADDNGEALFRYVLDGHNNDVKAYFVLSKNSPDYSRMQKIGPVIDNLSFRHKMLHLLSNCVISAQADDITINPFRGYHDSYRDILSDNKFIFLQHGIIQSDLSAWLNRYNRNFAGFVTSCHEEYDSILNTDSYFYDSSVVWLTGLPRFDRRLPQSGRYITILPTWRKYLAVSTNMKTFEREYDNTFITTEYRNYYNDLINNERLINAAQKRGYTIRFMPHPNIMPIISAFDKHPDVEFCSISDSYNDIYSTSSLLVTDYSSAIFDFVYMRKPIVYFQFDNKTFLDGNHVGRKGYFDYERDGFGEVEYDLEGTVDRIIEYMENGCQLKDKYRKRIDNFFAFNDQNNCQRVYEKIMELDKQEK